MPASPAAMTEAALTPRGRGARRMTRRRFLGAAAACSAALAPGSPAPSGIQAQAAAEPPAGAVVAITFDLEMARNFPRWEDTHWDYDKGNLNAETREYALEAARRVRVRGGVIHFFVVGRVFEQESVDWLKQLGDAGHPIGNHTYDHVNLLARRPEDIQFRFQRAPWLIAGKSPKQVLRENIELCTAAMGARLGIRPAGFRTPGGFAEGLAGREDLQEMLLELGFKWVSSKYPAHPYSAPGAAADAEVLRGIVAAQTAAQPFVYPTGLAEVPMSPISDVGAFRTCRWRLDDFLRALRLGVEWAIEQRAVFDLLAHPAVLYPNDPEFRVIELICELVQRAGARAKLADLETLVQRAHSAPRSA